MPNGILIVVESQGSLSSTSISLLQRRLLDVLYVLISQRFLPVTEIYNRINVLGAGVMPICHVTPNTKLFPRERASYPQDESGSGDIKMVNLSRVIGEEFKNIMRNSKKWTSISKISRRISRTVINQRLDRLQV